MSASDKPTNNNDEIDKQPPQDDNEEESASSSPGLSPTWGSYNNLARMMLEVATGKQRYPGGLQGLMSSTVTATEKIDGSNLAMWIKYLPKLGDRADPKNWSIVLLQGRYAPLWQKDGFEIYNGDEKSEDQGAEDDQDDQEESVESARAQLQADLKKLQALPGYGNAGKLGALIEKMRDYTVRVANSLQLDQIEIFGEAFRASQVVEQANAKKEIKKFIVAADRASWHPFGFKVPTSTKMQLTRLTTATHKIFSDAVDAKIVPKLPQTHEELIDFLMTGAKDYAVFPPPLYASKVALVDCIELVAPVLLRTDVKTRDFEGVFLVHDDGWYGCKFKTGSHDEQSKIPSLAELGLEVVASADDVIDPSTTNGNTTKRTTPLNELESKIVKVFALIAQIFKIKIQEEKGLVKKPAAVDSDAADRKKLEALMIADIEKATQREFSKALAFDHIERGQRQPIVDQLVPLVLKEVVKIYTDDGDKLPYSEDLLKQRCPVVVKGLVLKVPYNNPAGDDKKKSKNDDDDDQ